MKNIARWLTAILLLPAFVQAVPVTVTNAGFETDALADGAFTSGTLSGWTLAGAAGAFNPTTTHFTAEAPEGSNTAYSNGPTITQAVTTAVSGTLYTLTVLVGDRADTAFPGFTVGIQVNGVTMASATSPAPADDAFTLVTVQYTATGGDAGLPLGILLDSDGVQTNFDDVRLDAAAPPGFSKSFSPAIVPIGAVSTLTFTIDNSANGTAIGSLDFTDNLPAGMVIDTPSTASTTCSGGSLTALPGASVISYTGGTVSASSSCTVMVDVVANSLGVFANTSGDLTSDAGNSGPAASTLTTVAAPVFTKMFAPDVIGVMEISTLTFLIDNTANGPAATSLDFTDSFPTGVVVASPANASTTCSGGSLTALPGAGSISYTGGTVGGSATCSVSVNVTALEPGEMLNVSGDLTSSAGNSGPAFALLTVIAGGPIPTLTWPGLLTLVLLMLGAPLYRRFLDR